MSTNHESRTAASEVAPPISIEEKLTKEKNDKLTTRQIRYLDTASAYDLWSEVYDTDGNFLQALDTIEVPALLDAALSHLSNKSKLQILDLGCGTGRNTLHILEQGTRTIQTSWQLTAVDLSPKMLDIARSRCIEKIDSFPDTRALLPSLHFSTFDMIRADAAPSPELPMAANSADLVVSTLVLEHIPLPNFMRTISRLLAPGGLLVLTNMHSHMGSISQAGFVDPKTGDKIRPTSYAHSAEEAIKIASEYGFESVGWCEDTRWAIGHRSAPLKDVVITEELATRLGLRAKKWVGVSVWYGGIFKKEDC